MTTLLSSERLADERTARLGLWCVSGLTRDKITERAQAEGSLFAAAETVQSSRALAEKNLAEAEKLGARVLLPGDAEWPVAVDAVEGPPGALFVWGQLPAKLGVGIVGSRHASANGLSFAEALAAELAADGWPIVSGGAIGIDGAAHLGSLSKAKGSTVAVLGAGLDQLYPAQHVDLFKRIADGGGAVITEFPFGTPPWQGLFVRRNRLIAALSQVLVVVEATARSGSLGTARHAIKLGRPLLAMPGMPGQATAEGTNALLQKDEAKVCTGADDVRKALGLTVKKASSRARSRTMLCATGDAKLDHLQALIGLTPRSVDDLASAAGLTPAEIAASVTRLELLGLAVRGPGGAVYRPREVRGSL